MRVNKLLFFVFVLASFFICTVFSQNQAFAKQNPQTAYAKAEARYKRLLKDKKKRKLRTSWELCISRFDRIASSAPGTSFARLASYSRAEAREGLYKVSRVQADLDDAAKAYSECIQNYPGSQEATKASKRLKALGIAPAVPTLASTATTPAPSAAPAPALPSVGHLAEPEAPKIIGSSVIKGEGPVRINEIRHWSNTGYTRVVIDMDGAVQYSSTKLKDPDRLFFDLKDAK
ncbi:MAG: AMIN domain-containing protein, partial [Nitrospirota bacterium]